MFQELLTYDTELFLFLNGLGNSTWDGLWLFITSKWSAIPMYAFMLYLVYKHYGVKGVLVIMGCVALMITATDQLSNLFKHGVMRPRPCQIEALKPLIRQVAEDCGRYGYFSAHAASSMAAAVFLSLCLRKWYKPVTLLLLVWAGLTGYSRIYLGVHYPLDVLTGMAVGGLIGSLFYKLHVWGQRKYNPNLYVLKA